MANMVASLVQTISTHTGDITSVAFAVGKLATASGDKTVRLWSTEDFSELPCSPLLGHSYIIHKCVFSPFGTMLASCSTDGRLILWDVKTGEVTAQFQHASKNPLRTCYFSPDSSRIVTGSTDDTICMWDISTKQLVRSYSGMEDTVETITYSPDGHFLVSGSPNGDLYVWDATYGHGRHLFLKVDAHDMGVSCCAFSPTFGTAGKPDSTVANLLLATGGKDNLIKLWTFAAKVGSVEVLLKCHAELPGHTDYIMSCAFSPSGSILASGSLDKSVRFWDPLKGVALFTIDACHARFVTCCAFSMDGSLLATGGLDRMVKVWKLTDTSHIMYGLEGYEEPVEQEVPYLEVVQPLTGWTVDDVLRWLSDLGLEEYQENFRKNAIDGTELLSLTRDEFKTSLGISVLGHRNKLIRSRDLGGLVPPPEPVASTSKPSAGTLVDVSVPVPSKASSVDMSKPSKRWTVENVVQWLDTLGLAELQDTFSKNDIDGKELFALTTADLENSLGVSALGHRNKILRSRDPSSQAGTSSAFKVKASPKKKKTAAGSVEGQDEFLCPITMEVMKDPVIAADGYTYDRTAIRSWLESGKDRSPMTNAVLSHKNLTPNRTLKMLIQRHLEGK